MAFYDRFEAVATAIKAGIVPSEKDMLVKSDDGNVIAVFAAGFFTFPNGWEFWTVVDDDGWTAAHAAAEALKLPYDFSHWGIKDADGVTVAAVYAKAASRKGADSDEFKDCVSRLQKTSQKILEDTGNENNKDSAIDYLRNAEAVADQQFEWRMKKLREILNRSTIHPKKI